MWRNHCCGGPLVAQVQKVPFTYKGKTLELDQSGQFCQTCQEGFLTPSESRLNDPALRAFHNEVDGLLTPDQIKDVRKSLRLTQAEASRIFGGGPMAFSKYERGEITHSRALDIVLRLLMTGAITLATVKAVEPESVSAWTDNRAQACYPHQPQHAPALRKRLRAGSLGDATPSA